jgi:hypothetical protein
MAKPESVFWKEVKKNLKNISFTRLESWASAGVPDLLCYNKNGTFFTVELKVAFSKKLRFSPHQISFHMKHPNNSFVLAKVLVSGAIKLYGGAQVETLSFLGHEEVAELAGSWTKVQEKFSKL